MKVVKQSHSPDYTLEHVSGTCLWEMFVGHDCETCLWEMFIV